MRAKSGEIIVPPLPLFCSQNSIKEVQKVDRVLS